MPNQPRVFLHIGAMKTGTTYLQHMLRRHSDHLHAHGVTEARRFGRPTGAVSRVLARPASAPAARPWTEMIRRSHSEAGQHLVISSEFLSYARPQQISTLLAPLAESDVEVILTVRDQVGAIASQWQTLCRNFGDVTWPQYLKLIDPARSGDPASRAWTTYYRAQEIDRIVTDWSEAPGVSRVHVITLPHASGTTAAADLWDTFARIIGADHVPVDHPDSRVNPSVGQPSARVLSDLGQRWQAAGYAARTVRPGMRPFVTEALVPRLSVEPRPELDRPAWDFAERRNQIAVDAIERLVLSGRVTVHGSLNDLDSGQRPSTLRARAQPASRRQIRAAAAALWTAAAAHATVPAGTQPWGYRATLASTQRLIESSQAWQEAVATTGHVRAV